MSSQGYKDPEVGHPPMNWVKKGPDEAMIQDMYRGVGYITKKCFIDIEVGRGARPLRQMNEEECEAHVVGSSSLRCTASRRAQRQNCHR